MGEIAENTQNSKTLTITTIIIGSTSKFRNTLPTLILPKKIYAAGITLNKTQADSKTDRSYLFLTLNSFLNELNITSIPSIALTVKNALTSATAKGFKHIRKTEKPKEFSESDFVLNRRLKSTTASIIQERNAELEKSAKPH